MTRVAVNGQIWNYTEVLGDDSKTPIMILHGWGRSGNEWIKMAQDLSAWSGRKAYVLDLPGFGGSSLPQVKSLDEYLDLVLQFCAYLRIKKVIVICHSLGARVAILWASGKDREMVERIVLVDPAGPKEFSIKRAILRVVAGIFGFVPEDIRRSIVGRFLDEDYKNTPKLRQLYRVVVEKDLKRNLAQIVAPATVVWGENDQVVPMRMVKVYRRYLRDIRVRVVWGAEHDPHIDKYEQTLSILQEACE